MYVWWAMGLGDYIVYVENLQLFLLRECESVVLNSQLGMKVSNIADKCYVACAICNPKSNGSLL